MSKHSNFKHNTCDIDPGSKGTGNCHTLSCNTCDDCKGLSLGNATTIASYLQQLAQDNDTLTVGSGEGTNFAASGKPTVVGARPFGLYLDSMYKGGTSAPEDYPTNQTESTNGKLYFGSTPNNIEPTASFTNSDAARYRICTLSDDPYQKDAKSAPPLPNWFLTKVLSKLPDTVSWPPLKDLQQGKIPSDSTRPRCYDLLQAARANKSHQYNKRGKDGQTCKIKPDLKPND